MSRKCLDKIFLVLNLFLKDFISRAITVEILFQMIHFVMKPTPYPFSIKLGTDKIKTKQKQKSLPVKISRLSSSHKLAWAMQN